MIIRYFCKECCKALGKRFYAEAENAAGRKHCSRCGTNEPDYFKVELESEIDY